MEKQEVPIIHLPSRYNSLPFPSRKKQQHKKHHTHDEDNGFVLIKITEKGVAVLVSIIPQGNEDTIPKCDPDCGKDCVSGK